MPNASDLADGVRSGDRGALSRAITLVESTAAADLDRADALLTTLQPHFGGAWRIGISGAPGAGKSTLLDAIGSRLTAAGHRVAVLAVDPSSTRSGGSILGDKTRMQQLANDAGAYVRPSPGGNAAGGVARRTRDVIHLCEAAGFDIVFVETIGVGQAEVGVADMVDCLVLLLLGGAGDELQGIKRGIMELADVVAVTKADGDNLDRVRHACVDFRNALSLLRGAAAWSPPVVACSAIDGSGLDELWAAIVAHRAHLGETGLTARRRQQAVRAFQHTITELLTEAFFARPQVAARMTELGEAVARGELLPRTAAHRLLAAGDD